MDKNPDVSVLVFNKLTSIDSSKLQSILNQYEKMIVAEDHFAATGLYGVICEFCMRYSIYKPITSLAPADYVFEVGRTNEYFHKRFGFGAEEILSRL